MFAPVTVAEFEPSASPLSLVPFRARALTLLLCYGEDPALVAKIGLRSSGPLEALRLVEQVARIISPAPLPARPSFAGPRLQRLVPRLTRWILLLRSHPATRDADEIARLLKVDRATVFRHVQRASHAPARLR